jgi:hypothetical protein
MPDAIDAVRKALTEKTMAIQLLDELRAHFGSDLRFELQQANELWSGIAYSYKQTPPFCEIVVTVHLQPHPIVHELLHLKMYRNGFPVPIPDMGVSYPEAVALGNAVSHSMFIDEFLSFGFDKLDLFFERDKPEDLNQIEKDLEDSLKIPGYIKFARGAWNRFFFAQWIAGQMGFANQANEFMDIGRKKFPEIDADASWCESWFHRGDFRLPEKHAGAIT